ncbi:MAG: hypothetical protein A07HB70_01538 [uncultured archaeon A07HB70]|nr:MAG: hypothetical protein A07HB70_01538 [uncultured archaeon A07HB70]
MDLRSCYFCGAAGRTVGSTTVGDATVALCPACEEKLGRLRHAAGDADAGGAEPVTLGRDDEAETAEPPDSVRADEHPAGTDEDEGDNAGERGGTDDPPTGLRGLGAGERGGGSDYRSALRLLGNREFPMERAAAVDLVAGAYDLDRSECERLVDLTVERGLLEEADGELRRA